MTAQLFVTAPVFVLLGVIVTAAVGLWNARRADRADRRKSSGSVESADARTIFEAAEQLRHDLADRLALCHTEIQDLKARISVLEADVTDMTERLRREEARSARRRPSAPER